MAPTHTSERTARILKAIALTDWLDAGGISAEDASYLDKSDWVALAEAAQVHPPSQDTCALVISMLYRRHQVRSQLTPSSKTAQEAKVLQFPAPHERRQ